VRKFLALIACLGIVVCGTIPGLATVIDFEKGLTGLVGFLPSNYAGFTWEDQPEYVNKSFSLPVTVGIVGNYALYPKWYNNVGVIGAMARNAHFNFKGAYITPTTASGASGLWVNVEGYRNGEMVYNALVVTYTDHAYWFNFDFKNIDRLRFWSDSYYLPRFVMDNITYTDYVAQVPTSLLLLD
jgi:hypothetical protein